MVFATTTRDLTVSAANRPRTTAQVEVCVIRTHHRPHQTVHFPYQIAICFLFFNSSLKNQDYSPETKLLCQQERSDDFFLSIIEKRWRKEWISFNGERKKLEIQDGFFSLSRVSVEKFENFEKTKNTNRNSFDNRRSGYKLLSPLNLNDIRVCRGDRDIERYSKGVSWGVVRDH